MRTIKFKMLGEAERAFIIEGVSNEIRTDGRGRLDYRAISIDTNVISHLNGSSRVSLVQKIQQNLIFEGKYNNCSWSISKISGAFSIHAKLWIHRN